MTNEGTQVDVQELETYGRLAGQRADDTTDSATAVENVNLGVGSLGVAAWFFVDKLTAQKDALATDLRAMVDTLRKDADTASLNAREFTGNETKQADQFKRTDMP